MQSETSIWSRVRAARHHWSWRPEWRHDRPCLYWYLTFDPEAVAAAAGPEVLAAVAEAPWADPVPLEWTHLTLCDLGFVDQVPDHVVERAVAGVAEVLAPDDVPALRVGPLAGMDSAVVLVAEPLAELRRLQQLVRTATEAALGPGREVVHRHEFWPHVSLGYVNRSVPAAEVRALTEPFADLRASLRVQRLVLATVTRHRRHYEWSVRAELAVAKRSPSR
jgi:2'-5' RNA ligase